MLLLSNCFWCFIKELQVSYKHNKQTNIGSTNMERTAKRRSGSGFRNLMLLFSRRNRERETFTTEKRQSERTTANLHLALVVVVCVCSFFSLSSPHTTAATATVVDTHSRTREKRALFLVCCGKREACWAEYESLSLSHTYTHTH